MGKIYVIDTNVLIQSPGALECFEDNELVLPLVVLEELDGLKKAEGEKGYNARKVIRYLENLRRQDDLIAGAALPHGGRLRVEPNCIHEELPEGLPEDKGDNRILKVCFHLRDQKPILVTEYTDTILPCARTFFTTLPQLFDHPSGSICHPAQ